jgi:ubiquinone/menaquinone biosynthesis C-methylase UbiE
MMENIIMINWIQIWKDAYRANKQVWHDFFNNEERAQRYDSLETWWIDGKKRAADLNPDPSWSVLDIGAGPGILAIPLAHRVRSVTAVEPSSPMIRCLKNHLAEEQLRNVNIMNSRWEDVSAEEIEAHDLVIASYSLLFEDIQDALLKMNHLAKKEVVLYWFAGTPNWEKTMIDLFPQIYGRQLSQFPKCNVLFNILYDLGIYPDIEVLHKKYTREDPDYNEILSYIKSNLNITNKDHDEVLRNYIEDHWRRKDGSLVMDDPSKLVKISWRPMSLAV